jgi:oligo-1,6-glucosidase
MPVLFYLIYHLVPPINFVCFRLPSVVMKKINFIIIFILLFVTDFCSAQTSSTSDSIDRKWWKEAIVYQIYPRSFKDNDGDGIGDLKGIISKLDYIKSLGVNVVWLNPIYSSPNDDNGYDVSDYRNIMKDFGTMADFDSLLNGMHRRGIKLVMDLLVNHSSDEHEWFKQSRSSRANPYREYYHWWNAEDGTPPYRYSLFDVNHDAWKYDSLTNAYYLHYFSRKQPDLNWENPKLRQEVFDIMKFWANKGIDGFRLDAFGFAAKDTTWPMFPKDFEKNFSLYYSMQGNLHGYLQQMNKEVLSKYNVMSVAEGTGNTLEDAHNMVDENRHELNMAYPFEGVDVAKYIGYDLLHFKQVFSKWDSTFEQNGWVCIFLANHDQARMVSRFGNDSPQYREHSSEMLTTFILTMRGTPYYYNGDELGMTNAGFAGIKDYRDVQTLNEYQHLKNTGVDTTEYLKRISFGSRDNGRKPFQWNGTNNAGFTNGTPWIAVNKNYKEINEAQEEKDPNSILNYFRKIVQVRKNNLVLVYGKYTLLDKDNPDVYAYTRELNGTKFLILLNFKSKTSSFNTDIDLNNVKLISDNYASHSKDTLQPYEAAIYQLQ